MGEILTNVCCGDSSTYATGWTLVRGSLVPNWMFSVTDLTAVMAQSGYRLAFRTLLAHTDSQDNFGHALRLPGGHPSLLFMRSS